MTTSTNRNAAAVGAVWRTVTKRREARGRAWLVPELERRGLAVAVNDANNVVDLAVAGRLVELKVSSNTARRRNYWQFHVRRSQTRAAALFICLALTNTGYFPYIIPTPAVGGRSTIEITSHPDDYAGQWAQYKDAWHLLA
jgi:hypothetical protein